MTQQHIDSLYERRKYAGGFETALIDAYLKADKGNAKILEEAFKGTRFDLTPKTKVNPEHLETLLTGVSVDGKTAYQIIYEYLKENEQ